MFTGALVTVVALPALSIAVPLTVCPAPSPDNTWSAGQLAMPDSASAQVKCTVTGVLFHPFAFAAGESVAMIVGGSVSEPEIATVIELPGLLRSSTAISLEPSRSVTTRAIGDRTGPFSSFGVREKSDGPSTIW